MNEESSDWDFQSLSKVFEVFSIEGVDGVVVVSFVLVLLTSVVFLTKFIHYLQQSLEASREALVAPTVEPPQPSYNRSEEPCPVCYSTISFAVETDCYHLFCGNCMLGLIQYARIRNITCPVCRGQVMMLYPVFTVEEYNATRTSNEGHTRDDITSQIQEYNYLYSGRTRTFFQTVLEFPTFVRRFWRSFNDPNDILVRRQMKILFYGGLYLVISYIILPFDFFPELYFGLIGYLDDILVLIFALFYLTSVYRSLFFDLERANELR